jgi:hypothetical protein
MTPPAPSAAVSPFWLMDDVDVFEQGTQERDPLLDACHIILLMYM